MLYIEHMQRRDTKPCTSYMYVPKEIDSLLIAKTADSLKAKKQPIDTLIPALKDHPHQHSLMTLMWSRGQLICYSLWHMHTHSLQTKQTKFDGANKIIAYQAQ